MDKPYYNPEIWGGIECTINRVGNNFYDQLIYSGHYNRTDDIDKIAELNIKKIRYPILWEKHQPLKSTSINWDWTDNQLRKINSKNIDVIAGLVHHGSGPSFTDLSDEQFPYLLASYAKKVAQKYPWITYYTPVNEPLTTARFSGLYGLWYPHKKDPACFVKMLLNELKGTVLAMREIRSINPKAKLVQTEDLGKTYSTPKLGYQAEFENERRWLTFDILSGRFNKDHKLWNYFKNIGIPEDHLLFFIQNPCVPDLFGFNHYLTSERYLDERLDLYPIHTHGGNGIHTYADVEAVRVETNEETGLEVLLKEAWERYKKPMAITEVHLHCHREEQLRWFNYVWKTCCGLAAKGIDIKAVTSWGLLGSFGWNKLLTQPRGEYEPGVFDLRGGKLRETALVSFIKSLQGKNSCKHTLSCEEGWWKRNTRILYGPVIQQVRSNKPIETSPILIIGKNGTLGRAFARVCEERFLSYYITSRNECDISNIKQIGDIIAKLKPWAIINASGYVRVDDAEKESANCFRDNLNGPHNLALECKKEGIHLVTFSSDLVFNGNKRTPYVESDTPDPLNIYGRSKAESELIVLNENPSSLVIRTSAFFGPWDESNFIHYIRKKLSQDEPVLVANDLYISPTYVPDLVYTSLDLLIDNECGIWHIANRGEITWAELALEIADRYNLDKTLIEPVNAEYMPYSAKRPIYSVLGSEKGYLLPTLENALERYMNMEKKEKRQVA